MMKNIWMKGFIGWLLIVANLTWAENERGPMWRYDKGPWGKWVDLIADTPNYLEFGRAILGGKGDKFRWKMGPMHYRGRLGACSVKVFIVGQEGAQDENVSNRSFTGSTGTRMQKFLNYLGITEHYLFMNTFVYTINAQYTGKNGAPPKLKWLAQNPKSVITQHRHDMFGHMLDLNSQANCKKKRDKAKLALVIGVGTAGKDSVAAWLNHMAGSRICSNNDKKLPKTARLGAKEGYCWGQGALEGVLAIGVRHPGAAGKGGKSAAGGVRADFQDKANTVKKAMTAGLADGKKKRKISLPKDNVPGTNKKAPQFKGNDEGEFVYGYAAIPHWDFAFGTNHRMGFKATTSNRRKPHTIQVFSSAGKYNNKTHVVKYSDPKDKLNWKQVQKQVGKGDMGFESPRSKKFRTQFGDGPGEQWAKKLVKVYESVKNLGVGHVSFGPQGSFRGRFENAKVVFLADQGSNTDMFSARALTGDVGQRLQTVIDAAGLGKDYVIVRTVPVDTLGKPMGDVLKGLKSNYYAAMGELLESIETPLVVAVGNLSLAVASKLGHSEAIAMPLPKANNAKAVNESLKKLREALGNKSRTKYSGQLSFIPRGDLPAMTRWWMGTDGNRVDRARGKEEVVGNYYRVYAPRWSAQSRNRSLSKSGRYNEQESVAAFKADLKAGKIK